MFSISHRWSSTTTSCLSDRNKLLSIKANELAEETKLAMKINVTSFFIIVNMDKVEVRTKFRTECTHCSSLHLCPMWCTEINRLTCSLVRRLLLIYGTDLNMKGARCYDSIISTSHKLPRYLKYFFPYPLLLPLPPLSSPEDHPKVSRYSRQNQQELYHSAILSTFLSLSLK